MIIIKNEEQIEGIRRSCHLAANALEFAEQTVLELWEHCSTGEIDKKIEEYIRKSGAIPAPLGYRGYPRANCFSINEVICHGIPDEKVYLKEGDIVNVDITTILDGYYGDNSKMIAIGKISDEAHQLLDVAQNCLGLGIKQVKPGNQFWQIGKAISDEADAKGYSVVHQFCGHGVGVEFHEPPQVDHCRNDNNTEMLPGMIFTIEPMINQGVAEAVIDKSDGWTARTQDGKLSAQYEHTVLVTEDGVDILTR